MYDAQSLLESKMEAIVINQYLFSERPGDKSCNMVYCRVFMT